jgi:hypothetical protein
MTRRSRRRWTSPLAPCATTRSPSQPSATIRSDADKGSAGSWAARALGWGPVMLVAKGPDGQIAGACSAMPPGQCLSSPSQQLRMLPALFGFELISEQEVLGVTNRFMLRRTEGRQG